MIMIFASDEEGTKCKKSLLAAVVFLLSFAIIILVLVILLMLLKPFKSAEYNVGNLVPLKSAEYVVEKNSLKSTAEIKMEENIIYSTSAKETLVVSSLKLFNLNSLDGEVEPLKNIVFRPIMNHANGKENSTVEVIFPPFLMNTEFSYCLFSILELCYTSTASSSNSESMYACHRNPKIVFDLPIVWNRDHLTKHVLKNDSYTVVYSRSDRRIAAAQMFTGFWKYDSSFTDNDRHMLGLIQGNFHHRWVSRKNHHLHHDGIGMLFSGQNLKNLLSAKKVAFIGDSVMLGMVADVIRFSEYTADDVAESRAMSIYYPIDKMDVHKLFFMSRRSGLWHWNSTVTFLGLHDPNFVGLDNLRTHFEDDLTNVIQNNEVIVVNSGLHDFGDPSIQSFDEKVEKYCANLKWLAQKIRSVESSLGLERRRIIWKLTTHTFDYVSSRVDNDRKFDLPSHVMYINAIAADFAAANDWEVFDAWTPTYVADIHWFSDFAHFHYPKVMLQHDNAAELEQPPEGKKTACHDSSPSLPRGGLSRMISQMLLKMIFD